jgi:serine protease Do
MSRWYPPIALIAAGIILAPTLSHGQSANTENESGTTSQIVTRDTFRKLAAKASPAVVHIRIKSGIALGRSGAPRVQLPPGMAIPDEMREALERLLERELPNMTPGDQDALGFARSGSGVIIRSDGYIVTSNHVIAGIKPEDIVVNLPDGRTFEKVAVVGRDEMTDLAVLKIDGSNLPVLPWGDSDAIQVGDHVMAIGNPLEFTNSVSEGIVSAKHRTINKALIEDLIQTTAMINPGNSGGALVDLDGRLIGINMAIATSTGLWSGLGFAIPSKTARQVAEQLISRGKVGRGYLGIEMAPLTLGIASQLGYKGKSGIVVSGVVPGKAADRAGIERYDIIAKVDGRELRELADMHRNIGGRNPGDEVTLEVWRDNGGTIEKKDIRLKLDERPSPEELARARRTPRMPGEPIETEKFDSTLGMNFQPTADRVGLRVESVAPASRADRAGIRPGDIILEINRQKCTTVAEAEKAISGQKNDNHLLYLERNGNPTLVTIPPPNQTE